MSNDERAFLAAIHAQPDDNLPRLVYADWLDDQGEGERAAFIRLQCQRPDMSPTACTPPQVRDAYWTQELKYRLYAERWVTPLLPSFWKPEFERGLPMGLKCPAGEFLQYGPEVLAMLPITSLDLTGEGGIAEQVTALSGMCQLRSISRLSLYGDGREHWNAIVSSSHLHHLRELVFYEQSIGDDDIEALAASPLISQIELLALPNHEITDRGLTALACSVHPERFRELDLSGTSVSDVGLAAWTQSPRTTGVRKLDLGHNQFGDGGLIALAQSPSARSLADLVIDGDFSSVSLTALANSPHVEKLVSLRLSSRSLQVANGLTALADPVSLRPRSLYLVFDAATDEQWQRLFHSPMVANVESLFFRSKLNPSPALASALCSPWLSKLHTLALSLGTTQLDGNAVAHWFTEVFNLPNLQEVELKNRLGVAGIESLLAARHFPPNLKITAWLEDGTQASARLLAAYYQRFGSGLISANFPHRSVIETQKTESHST